MGQTPEEVPETNLQLFAYNIRVAGSDNPVPLPDNPTTV